MESTLPSEGSPTTVRLGGRLVMQRASQVLRELREALGDREHVKCDLSEVEAIDVIGLQLLLAASVTQSALGRTLVYQSASEPVRELCAAIGLDLENG